MERDAGNGHIGAEAIQSQNREREEDLLAQFGNFECIYKGA